MKNYLDETLKRLPLIVMCGSGIWYGVTKLNSIESKVDKLEMLSFKDKEVIDAKLEDVMLTARTNSNRTTEIEKDIIRLFAILPNRIESPKLKENEN